MIKKRKKDTEINESKQENITKNEIVENDENQINKDKEEIDNVFNYNTLLSDGSENILIKILKKRRN